MRKILSICVCLALVLVGGLTFAACGKKAETFKVKDEEGLTKAVKNAKSGDTIKLTGDVELTKALSINKKITIDLNGKTVTESVEYSNAAQSTMAMFLLKKGANVTVKGEGTVTSDDLYIFWVNNEDKKDEKTNLVVKGGTYTTDTTIVYLSYGSATVEGGTFKLAGDNPKTLWMLNGLDGKDQDPAKERATTAKIAVKGGTFHVGTNAQPLVLDKDATKTDAVVQKGYKVETVSEGVLKVVADSTK